MRKLDRDLVLDFLSFAAAVFVCLFFADLGNSSALPEIRESAYRESFTWAILSFGISYLLFLNIKHLLSFKFSLPDWSHGFVWFFTIISGIGLFIRFTDDAPVFNSEAFFLRLFLLTVFSAIPAWIIRRSAAHVISHWQP